MNIAIIAPKEKDDYLLNDCLDGLFQLPHLTLRITKGFIHPFPPEKIQEIELNENDFVEFARKADIIILAQRKGSTDFALAEKIGMWHKTIFLDGSELGKNRRFDPAIQKAVVEGRYTENGGIDMKMLRRCAGYFRREKPYIAGITPFPYSIQSSYTKHLDVQKPKDIDFVCIFGQDEFPILRRHAVSALEEYCQKNGFTFRTGKTKGFDFSLNRTAGRDEFYEILSRAKVGISIGGGGFDTVRFWETLANNCILMTERIDIFEPDSTELDYKRIYEFDTIDNFKSQLEKVGAFLRSGYDQNLLEAEYREILKRHSSKARVEKLISTSIEAIKTKTVQKEKEPKCAVIVSSCDKYSDLWEAFFTLFFRYWPDCPFPIYLISNTKSFNDARVKTILVGDDKGWASNTKFVLSKISEENILYLQEDYFLQSAVNTQMIKDILEYIQNTNVASVRLIGLPDPKHQHENPFGLYEITKGEKYRVSLQGAVWKKNVLLKLLVDGESGWEMEAKGTERSNTLAETFLSTRKKHPILDYYYYTGIKKGKWMPGALRLLRKEKISVNASKRGVHSEVKIIWGRFRNFIAELYG